MLSLKKSLVLVSALAAAPLSVAGSSLSEHMHMDLVARQQQDPNTPLFLNSPFCNYFQCSIIVVAGDPVVVNWLNAPPGDVQVDLMTDNSSKLAYSIARAPGVSQTCDAGQGYGVPVPGTTCGGFVFTVPSAWANGNYSMRATSVQNPSIDSYTDVILIQNKGEVKDTPFAVISGSVEGGPASTAAPSATSSAAGSSSAPASTAAPTSTGSARPTSSASRPASSSAAPSATSAPSSGTRASSSIVLGSVAVVALGLAVLL
ncbi:uncharacterized protein PFL1_00155 [Pseudozyma flocculosa PF-1]|uniref:Uncharacterized protein n=1 Tax=Pseudozyma flocculosa TaxID=84751 RepID=A0A5C3EVF8_9BASI|nr:uncharacterized protein PFL1_00155 [Pseudozyma flocculosa PF-1]EPQ31956.1 hypothetical protein PFL1_00155 [Pseudozyma flocculosa PF-1]SPO35129.1 uncharacterized protein PSFLO_00600 [Pseudozyma flocculosa]